MIKQQVLLVEAEQCRAGLLWGVAQGLPRACGSGGGDSY